MRNPSLALSLVFLASVACAPQVQRAPPSAVAVASHREPPTVRPAPPLATHRDAPDQAARIAGLTASAAAYTLCEQQAVVTCIAACDGGNSYACTELGDRYILGERVKRDRKRGIELLTRACEEGTEMACLRLANRVDVADPPRAAALRARVCVQGIVDPEDGCAQVIRMIEQASWTPDPPQRLAIYRRACALDRPSSACGQVKDLAVEGTSATTGASNGKLAPAHAR